MFALAALILSDNIFLISSQFYMTSRVDEFPNCKHKCFPNQMVAALSLSPDMFLVNFKILIVPDINYFPVAICHCVGSTYFGKDGRDFWLPFRI